MYKDGARRRDKLRGMPADSGRRGKPGPRPTRRRRTPADARQEILDGAAAALRRYEWRELTVARVMDETTLSRPSFYMYFDGLVDLLLQLTVGAQQEILSRSEGQQWLDRSLSFYDSARAALEGLVVLHQHHASTLGALFAASYHEPVFFEARREIERQFSAAISTWILEEVAAGRAPAGDARRLASALTMATEASLVRWAAEDPPVAADEMVDVLLRIWIGSIYGMTPEQVRERWPDPIGGVHPERRYDDPDAEVDDASG